MIIAIDGPAASGKSTSAKMLAKKLGFIYLDTGAMYRCVTLSILESSISLNDKVSINNLLSSINIRFEKNKENLLVILNGKDVSKRIRQLDVAAKVSAVSALSFVRESLVLVQRKTANNKNCVMEGRDIGTVVFPKAGIKFFLIADDFVRAKRRQLDLLDIGENRELDSILNDIRLRDKLDSERGHSPLTRAIDAIAVDTTKMTIREQVDYMINIINNKQETKQK